MKKALTVAGALMLATGVIWSGCGDSSGDGGSGGSGGSGGDGTTSSTKSATSSTKSSTSATVTSGPTTGSTTATGPGCDAPAMAPSDGSCVTLTTTGAGGGGGGGGGTPVNVECNPVTNEPCGAGEACDFSADGFVCYPDGNIGGLCETCDPQAGEFCQGTLSCDGALCIRFCCNDADCGTGTCTTGVSDAVPGVGLCLVE